MKYLLPTAIISMQCLYGQTEMQPVDQLVINVMSYPMNDIVHRCKKDYGYTDEDMIILERECKRFLALCCITTDPLDMYSSDVDNMWHSFILFTKEYAGFCHKTAGHFIHHEPKRSSAKELSEEQREENYRKFCNFVQLYENTFGEEIDDVWLLDRCENIETK